MKKVVTFVFGLLMLSGCGSVRYPRNYLLNIPALASHTSPRQVQLGPVAVREFRCPNYVCEGRIVYRPSPEEIAFYEFHRWAVSPSESITQSVIEALRARSPFKSVTVQGAGVRPAFVVTGSLERLEEADNARDVSAVCTISAQVTEVQTGLVVWTGTASETVRVDKRDVAGVVIGLSAAAGTAVDRLVASLTDELSQEQKAPGGEGR